jgi:hypothetical protein
MGNYIRKSIRQPTFIALQIVSVAIVLLVVWLLWVFIFVMPTSIRGSMYRIIVDSGFLGVNTIWLVYGIISLLIAQQIIKAILGVPLGSETEPADADYILPAPMQGHVFYTAKYLRAVPRRITLFLYLILAVQPILWYFGSHFGLTWEIFFLFLLVIFLLGEIGSVATQGLYALRKFVSQSRPYRRIFRLLFYVALIIGIILLLSPIWIVSGTYVASPTLNMANTLVGMLFNGAEPGSDGAFTTFFLPALPLVFLQLFVLYGFIIIGTRWLTDIVTVDLYEEIATVARRKGANIGALRRLPVNYTPKTSPFRAFFMKDFITGLRKPGKAFYIGGLVTNFVFAFLFITLAPTFGSVFPIPPEYLSLIETLYAVLLVVIIPLLAISSSDPFQGERGTLHLVRLSPLTPLRFTFIKYLQLLLTPLALAIPFAIYFAVFLGSLYLLPIALAILPHSIPIATAIGFGLGSRYPFASRAKNDTPIALMITFPVISWIAIIPVLLFQLGFIPGGLPLLLVGSLLISPYTILLVLILLSWSAHSYLRQE